MTDRHAVNPYPLRLPVELRDALDASAKGVGRSLHAEIVARLERTFAEDRAGLSDEMLMSIALQSELTLSLVRELSGGLKPEQQQALDALARAAAKVAERLRSE